MSALLEEAKAAPLSADVFLSYAGRLAEEIVDVPGMGPVLCRELDGDKRAMLLTILAPAASGGAVDFKRYQELLLQHGLADAASPEDARQPLLDMAQAKRAMRLGGAKVQLLLATIERLSGLNGNAAARAEENSEAPLSSSGSSE